MEKFEIENHRNILKRDVGIREKENLKNILDNLSNDEKEKLWNYIIHNYEMSDLRTALHLDYIFQIEGKSNKWNKKKIAIIMHINYSDLIDHCFEYIKGIPNYIDIYISTKGTSNIKQINKRIEGLYYKKIEIIVPQDRGREISSLLVACKEVVKKYEYICFVHDKKKNRGEPYQTVGQSFFDLLWENSVKNGTYIENIITTFEKEPRLGLLAPPIPYTSKFFMVGFLGWTSCFEKTKELAEYLKLNCVINEEYQPFILGMTFWCRTKAMEPLFEAKFSYEDFEPEPMAIDNTINHAIERILPYVAQSQGYYSGIMMTPEYASLYLTNYQYMLEQVIEKTLDDKGRKIEYIDIEDKKDKVNNFIKRNEQVYIYGAGKCGKACLSTIEKSLHNRILGFLVSDGKKTESICCGLPIYELKDIFPSQESGIIVALSYYNMQEVLPVLENRKFNNIEKYI